MNVNTNDRQVVHGNFLMYGVVAAATMIFCIYHFLFSASKMNVTDMYIILIFMMLSGVVLITIPAIEVIQQHKKWTFGKLAYLLAGLTGVTEAVVSLTALLTDNYYLYDKFNFIGFISLVGLAAISVCVHFAYETKSPD